MVAGNRRLLRKLTSMHGCNCRGLGTAVILIVKCVSFLGLYLFMYNICVYTHTHTHVCVYIYFLACTMKPVGSKLKDRLAKLKNIV
jgi:hypothetical protein